jgi:hypothetical protein
MYLLDSSSHFDYYCNILGEKMININCEFYSIWKGGFCVFYNELKPNIEDLADILLKGLGYD